MGACYIQKKGNNNKSEIRTDSEANNNKKPQGNNNNKKENESKQVAATNRDNNEGEIVLNQAMFVVKNEKEIMKTYKKVKELGGGSFGTVDLVVHKQTGSNRAMKRINKEGQNMKEKDIMNEIEILKKLDHINIVRIYEFFNTKDYYFLITEYCKEGELFDYLSKNGPFPEKQCAFIMYQLLSAVFFCHSSNIIHRDLKPENILIESIKKDRYLNIKVIDFGTAKLFDKSKVESKRIGSSYYMAPEVLSQNYTEKCDLWSCGVILYILLSVRPPFGGDSDEIIYSKIRIGEYNVTQPPFNKCSKEVLDLISKLLEKNPKKRLSADMALKHDWFTMMKTKDSLYATAKNNVKFHLNRLAGYRKGFKLQQAAVAFIVHNLPQTEEVNAIYSAFRLIDDNGDGRITKDELVKGLKIYNKNISNPEEEVDKIFASIDTDHNGFIEFEEFARVIVDKEKLVTDNIIKFSFDFFDKDGNGEITHQELLEIFGKRNSEKLQELIEEVDTDKNGKITIDEFKIMMKKIIMEDK